MRLGPSYKELLINQLLYVFPLDILDMLYLLSWLQHAVVLLPYCVYLMYNTRLILTLTMSYICHYVQHIPRIMHMVHVLLCFIVVRYPLILCFSVGTYFSGTLAIAKPERTMGLNHHI